MYEKYREGYLKRTCFVKWFEALPMLKEEGHKYDGTYDKIIEQFRFVNKRKLFV